MPVIPWARLLPRKQLHIKKVGQDNECQHPVGSNYVCLCVHFTWLFSHTTASLGLGTFLVTERDEGE